LEIAGGLNLYGLDGSPSDVVDPLGLATDGKPHGGAERAEKYGDNWQGASLKDARAKFAPDAEGVATDSGKMIYKNEATGMQVVHDTNGNYFRVEDTNLSGRRRYTDLDGNVPNNKTLPNGKQTGRTQGEYNEVTHFRNTDE
jgi:hypothetical protein